MPSLSLFPDGGKMIIRIHQPIPRGSRSKEPSITPLEVLNDFRAKNGYKTGGYKTVWSDGKYDVDVLMSWTSMFATDEGPEFPPECNALSLESYLRVKYNQSRGMEGMWRAVD